MLGDVEYGDLSTTTINNYKTTAKNIPFGIFSTQATIIKKLKSNYENPNMRASPNWSILSFKTKSLKVMI